MSAPLQEMTMAVYAHPEFRVDQNGVESGWKAQKSGVGRLILISQMGLLEDYPEEYVVRPDWQPLPRAEAGSLAPHMAELACREIARMGRLEAICLRFGALDEEEGPLAEDAVGAVEKALVVEALRGGYGWELHHVVSGGRFAAAR